MSVHVTSSRAHFLVNRIEDRYRSYRDDIPGDARSHEVDGLRPFTDYVFRVAGINDLGVGKYSNVLGARTLETGECFPLKSTDTLSCVFCCFVEDLRVFSVDCSTFTPKEFERCVCECDGGAAAVGSSGANQRQLEDIPTPVQKGICRRRLVTSGCWFMRYWTRTLKGRFAETERNVTVPSC